MKKVLGLGNALIDILTRTSSEQILHDLDLPRGSMQLIDVARMKAMDAATQTMQHCMVAGGSASNTIIGLAELGVETGFIGKVGSDLPGEIYEQDLIHHMVATYLLHSNTPTGRCQVFISPDGERTMATYLGAAIELVPDDLLESMFYGFDILHIEGYLVQNKALLQRVALLVKKMGMQFSIDLASYNVVAENLDFLQEYVKQNVDIVFANEEEARSFTLLDDPKQSVALMAQWTQVAVVKVGRRGSYVQQGSLCFEVEPKLVESVDSTGAGDLYASGFLYGYSLDLSLDLCGSLGSLCASEVIQQVGAKIPSEKWNEIRASISEIIK